MIHTLLLHQAFASKDQPGGTRHFELGQRLVANGQQFTVVASDVSYTTSERSGTGQFVTETWEDGIRILRVYTYAAQKKSYVLRVVSFLGFMVSSFIVGMRVRKIDVVMGTTPPIFQAVSAWLIAALRRRPFLLEIRDLWPEFAIDIGVLRNPFLIWLARRLESFLYNRADYLLVNSPAYRDYLIAKGVPPAKVRCIPNGVDSALFHPEERAQDLRNRLGVDDKFVVTYAGAIGMANEIDVLVHAAAMLKNRADIHILVVGDGKERNRLERLAKERELSNLTFTGSFPKSEMGNVLAASDACIAILRNIKMFTTTFPNKVFDYMAAGRPTILAIDGVIRKVIDEAEGGIFVQPGNAAELVRAIEMLADNPERARQMGQNARGYVVEHYCRDHQAKELLEFISMIVADWGTSSSKPAQPAVEGGIQ
jgi:glycosyltransferase involved in cell wall biosynthesis